MGSALERGVRDAHAPLRLRAAAPSPGPGPARTATYLASGLVHELAITVPAGGGFGGPTAYFALQALADALQRTALARRLGLDRGPRGRLVTLAIFLLPTPLLFPAAFRSRVVLPLAEAVVPAAVPRDAALGAVLALGIAVAAITHGLVLAAGVQVPRRLRWREELRSLSPFNRRIVWAYHAFVGFAVAGFGVLTALLLDDLLAGDRAALGLSALVAGWWGLRLLIDLAWYRPEDWPDGPEMAVGHATLTTGFLGMTATHAALLAAHASGALP